MFGAIFLFGAIVPYSFRETLRDENSSLQFSNLFWIVISQLGTIFVGYILFKQHLDINDWISTILLMASAIVAFSK